MNRRPYRIARVRSIVDLLAWIWIALAPWVVVAGIVLGAIDRPRAQSTVANRALASTVVAPESPEQAGAGAMFARTSDGWTPFDVVAMDVRVRVVGVLARATVTQTFRNDTGATIEGVYVFPLPERAAVHAMEMRIGERRIVSVVHERGQARRTYEIARGEGRKAALLEQGRPNLFRTSVANVNPDETVEVVLDYVHEVDRDGDTFSVTVPLTYTPRFGAPVFAASSARGRPRAASYGGTGTAAPEATVEVRIDPGMALELLDSPTHTVATRWDGRDVVVEPDGGAVRAVRDVTVRWTMAPSSRPRASVHLEERDDGTYALVHVLPPDDDLGPDVGLPTTTLFVLDVSGSMGGPSIVQAKRALDAALERLRPDDAFDVLTFAEDRVPFHRNFVSADRATIDAARRRIRGLDVRGGTDILGALTAAIAYPWPRTDERRVARIVFLTDGAVSNEDAILRGIVGRLGGVRLHTLGIGAAPNRWLMRAMAERGLGLCAFVRAEETAEDTVDRFLARLDRPVLASPHVAWSGAVPLSVYPARLPDLHAGEALTLVARFSPGDVPSAVALSGTADLGEVEVEFDAPDPVSGPAGVASRWARAKVDELLAALHDGATVDDVRDDVVAVALAHGLVTRYTSRVAVETFATAADDAVRVDVPAALAVALPRGGTLRPLARIAGVLLALGAAAMWLAMRIGARA